jgi:predicted ester cyclase
MDIKSRIKYFYETINSNNLIDEFTEYLDINCTVRIGKNIIPVGLDGMKQHSIDVRNTYPDLKMTITHQYCEGDYIVSEFIVEGTHQGKWLGMKPTGKKLTFTGVNIDKVANGKIVEHCGAMNTFETLFEEKIIKPA